MIDEEIILELSDILTELTYSINKPEREESFDLFISLKNLYDSIGYYSYNDLDPKDVWAFSLLTTLRLQNLTSFKDTRIENRIKKLNVKLQQYLDGVHGSKNVMVIPEWPEPIVEKEQMERDLKMMIWRFGCCLAINLRAGATKKHRLIYFLLKFLDFLNKGLYGPEGVSMIEDNLIQFENEFESISGELGKIGFPYDIIKKEFAFTVNALRTKFQEHSVSGIIDLDRSPNHIKDIDAISLRQRIESLRRISSIEELLHIMETLHYASISVDAKDFDEISQLFDLFFDNLKYKGLYKKFHTNYKYKKFLANFMQISHDFKLSHDPIKDIVLSFFKKNEGKAFTIKALDIRLENSLKGRVKKKSIKKKILRILKFLVQREIIEQVSKNNEFFYFYESHK